MPDTSAEPQSQEDWAAHFAREEARYRDGEMRLSTPDEADHDPDARQR